MLLSAQFVRSGAEEIIGGYVIESAQDNQVVNGHFVGAPLIAGIHGLGRTQHLGDLRLGQVVIFPQTPQFFDKSLQMTTPHYSMHIV